MHRNPSTQRHITLGQSIPEVQSKGHNLQVQALSSNDVSSDLCERFLEFLSELIGTHDFTSLSHLSKEFFKAAEQSDERSFVDICHFAIEVDNC